ncbi:F-box/kelch-repeat protein At3g06240-like [Cucurbita pepo subsp. pepo]|uniref:F-box/kelch-repeat protein At3g06240-like n=1 Tax=Cucurbita pepo subsp. pepo TaxID=3664 RepID=UPI000C9D4597|nr:F-box/kelch-repeat protein At3g06240-like [Cucurbita pepo subsp. pepo]
MVDFENFMYIPSIIKLSLAPSRSMSILDVNNPFKNNESFNICGHSHDLVCLSFDRDIFLFNLTTEKFRKLPLSIIHYLGDTYDIDFSFTSAVGFGYNSNSRDFKVIRVVEFWNRYGETDFSTRVEIYDLRKERWREIESPTYGRASKSPVASQMHHEGTYYWWAYKEGGTNIIHTFDMSEEVFGKISVPNNVAAEREEYISMGILNRSIVIFHYRVTGNEKTFDIWEMEKDVISWSKLMTIGPVLGVEKPLSFVNSDELLMETNEGQVIYYNIKTHMTKVLPLKGRPCVFTTNCLDFNLQEERESRMNF